MNNTKKDRISFVKNCKKVITENKGELIETVEAKDNDKIVIHKEVYSIKTKDNLLRITLFNEDDHKIMYSVFMCFETPTDYCNNKFSGKHNFHSTDSVERAISVFERFLIHAIENV